MAPPGNKTASQSGTRRDRRKSRAVPYLIWVWRAEIRSVGQANEELEANEAGDGLGGGGRRKTTSDDLLVSVAKLEAKMGRIMRSPNLC